MLTISVFPSFLDTQNLSMSSLGYKAFCIVINFLSICLSSTLVYFMNGPVYLTRRTAYVFIPLMRFLLLSLVSRCFLVCLKYSFLFSFFFHHCLFDCVHFQYSQILVIYFLPSVLMLSCFGSSSPSIVCLFPLFIMSMVHFSISKSIPTFLLYILIVCTMFFTFENSLILSISPNQVVKLL